MKKQKKRKSILLAVLFILIVGCGAAGVAIYKKYAPSSVRREMSKQYQDIAQGQYMLVFDGEVLQERGIASEGKPYIPVEFASKYFNKRFYWDKKEKKFCYSTPKDVMTVEMDSKDYMVGRKLEKADFNILVKQGDQIYVSIDFISQFSGCKFKAYENPSRIVATGNYDTKYLFGKMAKKTRLRVGPNKKFEWLVEVPEEHEVYIDQDTPMENEYVKVMTEDGIEGYVPQDSFSAKEERVIESSYKSEEYEHILLDKTISLGWHQVTNMDTNNYLSTVLAKTKGINVISPTWFALTDNKGNFSSLASENYVRTAHSKGVQVWALVSDFNKGIKLSRVLGKTSTRTTLINNLIAKAIQYNVDGLNIDFETVTKDSAPAYLEFLRELQIKCHSNNLILSTDNYTPQNFNAHYDLEEQGKVVDYVVIMAYDEHFAGGQESGSVSSISFVKDGVTNVISKVPREQVVIGIPFYTRLWKEEPQDDGSVKVTSEAYGMDGAQKALKENGAMAKWDDTTAQYFSEFKSGKSTFKIWMEEEKSMEEKLKVITEQKVAGCAYWKLGLERESVWDVITKYVHE